MSILLALLVSLAWGVLALPGVWILRRLAPARSWIWHCVVGSVTGWGAAVYMAYACAVWDIRLFYPAFLVLFFVAWIGRGRACATPETCADRESKWLVAVLLIVAASRMGVALWHTLPRGWDPTFHMIFCRKIMLANQLIADWTPFEAVDVVYPLGSHVLIALIAKTLLVEPDVVFNFLLPLIGVVTTAVVYTLAGSATGSRRLSLFAASSYGLWAGMGSISYYSWGGLPNSLAMVFLLTIIQLLMEGPFRGKQSLLCLLCSSLILTHHHVMVTAIAIFAITLLAAWHWRDWAIMRQLLIMAAGASLLASPHLLACLLKASTVGSTGVLKFTEGYFPLLRYPGDMGYLFLGSAMLGIVLYAISRLGRRPTGAVIHRLIPLTCATLLGMYILCAYVYPPLAQRKFGYPYVAFTPSRFITDMVPLLSLYCGFCLITITRWAERSLPVVMVAVILAGASQLSLWKALLSQAEKPGYLRACAWIRQNMPPETVIFTDESWAPYLTWRRTLYTPIPVSEAGYQMNYLPYWRRHVANIVMGRAPDDPGMPVVRIVSSPASDAILLWRDEASGFAVIRLTSGSRPQPIP